MCNANDAQLTELITAVTGSSVESQAPNSPAQATFDLVIEAVAGNVIGGSGAPYTLSVSAMDLTAMAAVPGLTVLVPPIVNPGAFDLAHGWTPTPPPPGIPADFVFNQRHKVAVPGGLAGHTLQYTASLLTPNGQVVSIVESELFTLV